MSVTWSLPVTPRALWFWGITFNHATMGTQTVGGRDNWEWCVRKTRQFFTDSILIVMAVSDLYVILLRKFFGWLHIPWFETEGNLDHPLNPPPYLGNSRKLPILSLAEFLLVCEMLLSVEKPLVLLLLQSKLTFVGHLGASSSEYLEIISFH